MILLDALADLLVGALLGQPDGQVNDWNIGSRDTEGHAGQLAVQLGDDLADSLGGSGGSRDDVLSSSATVAPVLVGGSVNGLLSGGDGVNGGHEAFDDAEVVVDNLGDGGQAVGGAAGIWDDVLVGVVLLVVDAHHVHGGIGRGGGDDDFLGSLLDEMLTLNNNSIHIGQKGNHLNKTNLRITTGKR